mgnify:CR=1 FL=1
MVKHISLQEKSDLELIHEYKKGHNTMGILYARYSNLVFGSCLKYLKDRTKAEDATGEIFLMLSEKLKSHKVDYFKSWLYTLTRNYCFDQLRKINRNREKISEAEIMYSDIIFHPDDVQDDERIVKLKNCISQLNEEQSGVVESFYYQKLSYKEIAESMSCSWDKVRSLIQNARRNLKICIES